MRFHAYVCSQRFAFFRAEYMSGQCIPVFSQQLDLTVTSLVLSTSLNIVMLHQGQIATALELLLKISLKCSY